MTYLMVTLFIMLGYLMEGIVGFGGAVIALPLVAKVLGMKSAVGVLSMISIIAAAIIVARDIKYVNWKEFFKILGITCMGMPLGMWLFSSLPEAPLKIMLGIFMIVSSVYGLYKEAKKKKDTGLVVKERKPFLRALQILLLFLGGVVQGAFVCGGPLIVVYTSSAIKNKTTFRATLAMLWVVLDAAVIIKNFYIGIMTPEVLGAVAWSIPALIVILIVTNHLHKKIKGEKFSKFIYSALIISGLFMFQ